MCTRIVLVHGQEEARADLRSLLADSGYIVTAEAADGESAVTLARTLKPDLVLLEAKLPGKNGIWAAGVLHRERLAPAVLMADSSEPALVARAVRCGAFGCVVKPFSSRSLIPLIEVGIERFRLAHALRAQADAVRGQIEEQKTLERAKAALNDELGLSEEQARQRLESLAAKAGKSVLEVAAAVVLAARAR